MMTVSRQSSSMLPFNSKTVEMHYLPNMSDEKIWKSLRNKKPFLKPGAVSP